MPPTGTAVAGVKPTVTVSVFRVPGTLFAGVVNARAEPAVRIPPSEGTAGAVVSCWSLVVAMLYVAATVGPPVVTAPATNVRVCAPAARVAPATVQVTVSAVVVVSLLRAQLALTPVVVKVLDLVASTAMK